MKKKYEKPMIIIENFSLSTTIAGNCESIVGNPTQGTCAVIGTGEINMFSGTIRACDFTPEDMGGVEDIYDGFCYHIPTSEKNLFNS